MSDDLVWSRRREGEDNWRAPSNATTGTYAVYVMTDYGSPRTYGVLLKDGHSYGTEIYVGMASVDSVKDILQQHHQKACRAKRWADYMRDNEPPVHHIPPGPCGKRMRFMSETQYHCELLSGHAGWHRNGECSWGVAGITEEGLA